MHENDTKLLKQVKIPMTIKQQPNRYYIELGFYF
jgi:hypothetical protein